MMVIFTFIIIIHELGHFITALCLRWPVRKVVIYPYGGCSYFDNDINVPLWQELLVLIMGPLMQIIVVNILPLDIDNLVLLHRYSNLILIFNLLPIYPLDGGRLIQIVLSYFISYYRVLVITFYFSWLLFFCLFFSSIFFYPNFILSLVLGLLLITLWQERHKTSYMYRKFLLERYLNNYQFRRRKQISNHKQMKRDVMHTYSLYYNEKEYLKELFNGNVLN